LNSIFASWNMYCGIVSRFHKLIKSIFFVCNHLNALSPIVVNDWGKVIIGMGCKSKSRKNNRC
jgi:hypothetical protein